MKCVLRFVVFVIICFKVKAHSINSQSNGDLAQGTRRTGQNKTVELVSDVMDRLYGVFLKRYPDFNAEQLQSFTELALKNIKRYEDFVNAEKKVMEHVGSWISGAWNKDSLIQKTLFGTIINKSIERTHDSFGIQDCGLLPGDAQTGLYTINLGDDILFQVMCNMDVDEGKWLVIQQRLDGSVDFQRTWNEYREGFGNLEGEFWLGNDKIYRITSSGDYELRVDIRDWDGKSWYAHYKTFKIGNESQKYKLTINGYSGTAGDSFEYHNEMFFSTKDRDNDKYSGKCSKAMGGNGGWWFNNCEYVNLNGQHSKSSADSGINWYKAKNSHYSMKFARMMIRRL